MSKYDPELFDATHRGNPGDLDFYLDFCRDCEDILEMGCGSGRIGLPLVRQGGRITGVDIHPGMLALYRSRAKSLSASERRRLRLIHAPMEEPGLLAGEVFDRILIPYNGLLCLLSDAQVVSCFCTAARLLRRGGLLALDVYHVPDDMGQIQWDEDALCQYSFVTSIAFDGKSVDVFEKQLPSDGWDRFDVAYLYRSVAPDGSVCEVEYEIPQRCMTIPRMETLLEESGFQLQTILADFHAGTFDDDTTQVAFVARRT